MPSSPLPCVRAPLARRPASCSVRRLGTPLLPAAARVSTPPTWARAAGRLPAPRAAPPGVREGVQERSHASSGSPAAKGAPALAVQGPRAAHHITPEAGAAGAANAAGPTAAQGTLFGAIALITGSTVGAGEPVCSSWPSHRQASQLLPPGAVSALLFGPKASCSALHTCALLTPHPPRPARCRRHACAALRHCARGVWPHRRPAGGPLGAAHNGGAADC